METQHDTLRQQYMTDVSALLGKLRELSQTNQANTLLAIARLEATGTMGKQQPILITHILYHMLLTHYATTTRAQHIYNTTPLQPTTISS